MIGDAAQETRPSIGAGTPASQQVSWFEVYSYATRLAAQHGLTLEPQPIPGTPQWCGMPDDDARKLLALVLGGVREALANDARQAAQADASHEISAAADWPALAQRIARGRDAYIPRKAAS